MNSTYLIKPSEIFNVSNAEALILKKTNPETLKVRIYDLCTSLERRLLELIPENETEIIKILSTSVNQQKPEKFLRNLLINMFDEEKMQFMDCYCWKVYIDFSPFLINLDDLQQCFQKINVFWKETARLEFDRQDPYYFFTIRQLI